MAFDLSSFFDNGGGGFDPWGSSADPYYAGNGSVYDPTGAGLGGFNVSSFDPFGGLGGGLGGAITPAAAGLGGFLGSLLSGGGSSGGSNGTINVNSGGGTNILDLLAQNPYLASQFLTPGAAGTPGTTGNGVPDFITNLAHLFGGIFPNLGGNGSTPGFGGSSSGSSSSTGGSSTNGTGTNGTNPASNNPLANALGPVLSGLLGLGNAGLNAFGAVNALGQQDWLNQNKTSTAGMLQSLLNGNAGGANAEAGQVLPQMTALMQALGPAYTNGLTQENNGLQGGFQGLSSFTTPTQTSQVPGLQGVFDQLGGLQSFGNSLLGGVSPLALGNAPGQQQGLAQALQLATGSNSGQGALSNTALSLLNSGQSPLSAASQSAAINALLNGGMTNGLNSLTNPATGLANGQLPIAQQLAQTGLNITSQNPLLSMDQVQSMATDQSATQSNNQLNALRQQLLDRTGVTGPAIASGSQNDLLNQIGDQAMQSVAQARTNAMLGQEGLQSQLFNTGASMANAGQQGLLQGQSLGMNSLLQQASQALANQTGLGGLGNQGLNTYLAQLGLGGNLVGQGSQSQLGGLGALSQLLGTQTGATNALSGLLGQTGGLTGQAGSDVFGLQNLGLNQNQAAYSALNSLLGQQNTQNSGLLSGLSTTAQYPFNWATTLQGQVPGLGGSIASLFGGTTQPSNYFATPQGAGVFNGTVLGTGGLQTPTPTGTH